MEFSNNPGADAYRLDKNGDISHISYDKYLNPQCFCDNAKPYTHII